MEVLEQWNSNWKKKYLAFAGETSDSANGGWWLGDVKVAIGTIFRRGWVQQWTRIADNEFSALNKHLQLPWIQRRWVFQIADEVLADLAGEKREYREFDGVLYNKKSISSAKSYALPALLNRPKYWQNHDYLIRKDVLKYQSFSDKTNNQHFHSVF